MKKIFFASSFIILFSVLSLFYYNSTKTAYAIACYTDPLTYCTTNNSGSWINSQFCVYSSVSLSNPHNCYSTEYTPGWCVDTCIGYAVHTGNYLSSWGCDSATGYGNYCQVNGGYCQVNDTFESSATLWSATYLCPSSSNPPSNVDVKATVWNSTRTTAFAGELDSNGPVWVYSQAPYQISWGAVTDATSCTLNGTSVSTSGGTINTYTYPLGQSSLTYTLSCTGSGGTTNDTVTLNLPPKPTNLIMSCPVPGTTSTFSWTAPAGYTAFYTRARNDTTGTDLTTSTAWDENFVGTSKSFGTVVNNTYHSWVFTREPTTGAWSDNAISNTVTCQAASSCIGAGSGTGIIGKYYDGMTLGTLVTTRIDTNVNFNPADSLGVNYANSPDGNTFSVHWEGQVEPRCTENYTFYTTSDDGVRLWVNGTQLVNNWTDHGTTENSGTISLTAGQKYPIVMEFYENGGGAVSQLSWSSPSTAKAIIPQTQLYPMVLTPNLTVSTWSVFAGDDGYTTPWYYPVNYDGNVEMYLNGNYTIYWNAVSGATSCTLNGTSVSTSGGSMRFPNITSSTTYTFSCVNSAGVTYSDTLNVTIPPKPTNLTATCTGTNVSSSWTLPSGYTASYWRADPILGTWPPMFQDDNAGTSKSFTGTAGQTYSVWVHTKNPLNSAWGDNINTTVTCPLAPTASLSASPTSGTAPLTTRLTWSSTNATSCTAVGGWSGTNKPTSGTQDIVGLSSNTSFGIYCTNGSTNSPTASVNVTVSLPSYNLTVTKTTGGSVKSGDGLISCGTTCTRSYTQGSSVTLTAVPDSANWKFVGWSGACTGTSASCTLTINSATSVTAIFAPRSFIYQEF